jgi:hypothetical protein
MIPISGFENYAVTETGVVVNTNSGKVLKPSLNENGYLYVSFWKDKKGHSRTVHRLVATAYIPNPLDKPFVNHLDANRGNPHRGNLEWCTQSENIKHAYGIGNMSQKQNFTSDELDWLLNEVLQNKTMTELALAMKVGLSRLTINLRKHAYKVELTKEFEVILTEQKRERNTQANEQKKTPIQQLDREGNVLAVFPSLSAAARALGKDTSGPISNALNPNNSQRIGYGYQWKYI